ARDVAERSVRICEELRLGSMKTAFGLCYIVAADIGRRRFADAERTLERLSSLGIEQTRILVAEQRNLRTKLLLARGDAAAALAPVVIASRAYPPLLELVQSDALAGPIARDLAARAHDAALARRLGVALARTNGETTPGLGPLTPRENEVLELMTLGLANAE